MRDRIARDSARGALTSVTAVQTDVPLDVCGVTKAFQRSRFAALGRGKSSRSRTHVAVRDVSFRMGLGEIYGVIGANGSGKSTLIRILSTLLLPDEGEVSVFGLDAVRDPLAVRGLLNRVSADPSFFRAMSALENLLFFGRAYGMPGSLVRRRSREVLERLGLNGDRTREPMLHL